MQEFNRDSSITRALLHASTLALNFLFPPVCPGCETYLGIKTNPCELCPKCKQDLGIAWREHAYRQKNPKALEAIFCFGSYASEPLKTLIHKMKYHKKDWILGVLRQPLVEFFEFSHMSDLVDCVVPVPLHPRRQRQRGFNQAELIGRLAAVALKKPIYSKALTRVRFTRPQMSISDARLRKSNIREAFEPGPDFSRAGGRILLVDDVATTGATLEDCARVFRARGLARIFGFVLAG